MKSAKYFRIGLTLFVGMLGCVERYDPPVIRRNTNFLVVDAFLNSSEGNVTVKLSRTIPLYSEDPIPLEQNAIVNLGEEGGPNYPLAEMGNGVYSHANIPVNAEKRYRLQIRTSDGTEYFSRYETLKQAPPIDAIYFGAEDDGMVIYVDAHDPAGTTRYYKWGYKETWEYNAPFYSWLMFKGGVIEPRFAAESIYTCWKTEIPSDLIVGSSIKLQQDVISRFPITFIEAGSSKISQKYSILVWQQAITEEAYNYWLQLKQTTESLGGLFDPMPTQFNGNLYNATDPSEPVLGYFSGGTVEEKRIYIRLSEIPNHLERFPSSSCEMDTIPADEISEYDDGTLLIGSFGMPVIEGYLTSEVRCIDCRTQGGTLIKPDFWE